MSTQATQATSQAVLSFEARAEPQYWQDDPLAAFQSWRRSLKAANGYGYSARSIAQHCAMWAQLVAFCEREGTHVLRVRPEELDRFFVGLTGRPIKNGQHTLRYQEGDVPAAAVSTRRRYAQLLDKTFEHLRKQRLRPGNPIAPLMQVLAKPEAPGFVSYLSKAEEKAFIDHVQATAEDDWFAHRDKCWLLLLAGSGLSVGELTALRVGDVALADYAPALQVGQRGLKHAHVAPILEFALATLQAWLKRIEGAAVDAPLFADAPGSAQPMAARDVYDATRAALEASGFFGKQRGPQTLRNTFIRRQLWNDKDPAEVMGWTGLASERTIKKLLRTLPNRQGVSPA